MGFMVCYGFKQELYAMRDAKKAQQRKILT